VHPSRQRMPSLRRQLASLQQKLVNMEEHAGKENAPPVGNVTAVERCIGVGQMCARPTKWSKWELLRTLVTSTNVLSLLTRLGDPHPLLLTDEGEKEKSESIDLTSLPARLAADTDDMLRWPLALIAATVSVGLVLAVGEQEVVI